MSKPMYSEEEKRRRRRQKNNEAASRWRQKQLRLIETLSKEVEVLQTTNTYLQTQVEHLSKDNCEYKFIVEVHQQTCNVKSMTNTCHLPIRFTDAPSCADGSAT
jgi:bZIP transcription factor